MLACPAHPLIGGQLTRRIGTLSFVSLDCLEGKCGICMRGSWYKHRPHQDPPIAPLCQHPCHEAQPEVIVLYDVGGSGEATDSGIVDRVENPVASPPALVASPIPPPPNGKGEGRIESSAEGRLSPGPFNCGRCYAVNRQDQDHCWSCGLSFRAW